MKGYIRASVFWLQAKRWMKAVGKWEADSSNDHQMKEGKDSTTVRKIEVDQILLSKPD